MKKIFIWQTLAVILPLFFFVPVFAVEKENITMYSTWDNMEVDKCASAWLIQRFIDKKAVFQFHPKGTLITRGIAFDVPQADIRRYHNMASFEYLIQQHNISDPALLKIAAIIHDIEINYWGRKQLKQSEEVKKNVQKIIDTAGTAAECLKQTFVYFDELYVRVCHQ